MKPQRILRVSLGLLCATGASAQSVVSQLGGFLERAQDIPSQEVAAQVNPLSLFLQQGQPSFPLEQSPSFTIASSQSSMYDSATSTGYEPSASTPAAIEPTPFARPKGLVTVRSMQVSNPNADSKIYFGAGSEFSMGTDSAGNFVVQQASAASPLLSLDSQDTLHLGSSRVETLSLNTVNGISVRGVKQWQLVYSDDFSSPVAGWGPPGVTQCGGVFMLGGFCKLSTGEVNKTFTGLPPHKQLKVQASYHFIDRWIGETGYMKLDVGINGCDVPVWSEQYDQQTSQNGMSLCGNTEIPEGKFASPVDVTVPHRQDSITVTFGSTIGGSDPCDESWGVSAVEIWVRN